VASDRDGVSSFAFVREVPVVNRPVGSTFVFFGFAVPAGTGRCWVNAWPIVFSRRGADHGRASPQGVARLFHSIRTRSRPIAMDILGSVLGDRGVLRCCRSGGTSPVVWGVGHGHGVRAGDRRGRPTVAAPLPRWSPSSPCSRLSRAAGRHGHVGPPYIQDHRVTPISGGGTQRLSGERQTGSPTRTIMDVAEAAYGWSRRTACPMSARRTTRSQPSSSSAAGNRK